MSVKQEHAGESYNTIIKRKPVPEETKDKVKDKQPRWNIEEEENKEDIIISSSSDDDDDIVVSKPSTREEFKNLEQKLMQTRQGRIQLQKLCKEDSLMQKWIKEISREVVRPYLKVPIYEMWGIDTTAAKKNQNIQNYIKLYTGNHLKHGTWYIFQCGKNISPEGYNTKEDADDMAHASDLESLVACAGHMSGYLLGCRKQLS